jgi:hypothetical protein
MKLIHVAIAGGALWLAYKWGCMKGKEAAAAKVVPVETNPQGSANGT